MKYNNSPSYQQDFNLISNQQSLLPHNELIPIIEKKEKEILNQPILVNKINNKSINSIPLSDIDTWGTIPHNINCPFCHKNVTTLVETNFNFGSCCLCFWLSCIVWGIILISMGKEIGCADVIHKCPYCKKVIGIYHSC